LQSSSRNGILYINFGIAFYNSGNHLVKGKTHMAIGREIVIGDDYRNMVERVLPRFGLTRAEVFSAIPPSAIEQAVRTQPLASWLAQRASAGHVDELLIATHVSGPNGIGVANLIKSENPQAFRQHCVYKGLWGNEQGNNNPYGDRNPIYDDNGGVIPTGRLDTVIMLGDIIDPSTGRKAYAPGLVYTSKTVDQQKEAFAADAAVLGEQGIKIRTASAGHMAVDSVARQEAGLPQQLGVTRLIHLPAQAVGGDSCVPDVSRNGERMRFSGSFVGDSWYSFGVRRVVDLPIAPLGA
jgi:hypothetical protein